MAAKTPKLKLEEAIQHLTVAVEKQNRNIETLTNLLGRAVYPKESIDALVGSLRDVNNNLNTLIRDKR